MIGKIIRKAIVAASGCFVTFQRIVALELGRTAGITVNTSEDGKFHTITTMIVCLFDIDGTLLSSGGAGKAALEAALTQDFAIAIRGQVPYSGRTDRAIIRELFHVHGIADTSANLERIVAGYLRRLPEYLQAHQGRVLPGIGELLESLRCRPDVALGLLTGNVRAGAKAKLGHFGLFDKFAFGGFGDNHFDRDDVAREALAEVRRHVGAHVQSEQVWVIGDTPLDVRCARAIGARVAAVATGIHTLADLFDTGADLVLPNLADATPLLERLDEFV
jgi:phosphoglycolate phosphatase